MRTKNLISAVKSSAIEVFKELGPGYNEKVYEEALSYEFRLRDISYERQKNCEVLYKKHWVGTTQTDLIVRNRLIVEIKAVKNLAESHRNQVRAYYETSSLSQGVLLNFPKDGDKIEIEKVRPVSIKKKTKPISKKGKVKNVLNRVEEAANEVCGVLGTEFAYRGDESIYERALSVEFRLRRIPYVFQTSEILYKNHVVSCIPAFVVDGKYLISLARGEQISEGQEEEMRFALGLSRLKEGLIINFPPEAVTVEVKKIRVK